MPSLKLMCITGSLLLGLTSVVLSQGQEQTAPNESAKRQNAQQANNKPNIPALIKRLGDKDQRIASEASERLAELGVDAVPALIEVMTKGNTQVRLFAAFAMLEIKPDRLDTIAVLIGILKDKSAHYLTRRYAAFGLARTAQGVKALAGVLKDPDLEVRVSAAFAFEDLSEGDPNDGSERQAALKSVIPAIVEALNDDSEIVRTIIGETVGQLGTDAESYMPKDNVGSQSVIGKNADDKITADEEQAARALALKFATRLRETEGNIEPLISELFADDFDECLRDESLAEESFDSPFPYIAHNVIVEVNWQELRRFYITAVKSYLLFDHFAQIYFATLPPDKRESETDENDYPPELARLIQGDPTINELFVEWHRREEMKKADDQRRESSGEPEPHPGEGIVTTIAQLRGLSNLGEKVLEWMRQWLITHPAPPGFDLGQDKSFHVYSGSHALLIEKTSCGRPAGTRLIHVRVQISLLMQFHLALVSENGQMRILRAVPMLDGD